MTTDGKLHYVVFEKEEDHPLAFRDPRNQYVNHNNKFIEVEGQPKAYAFNKTKQFFKTQYGRNYSPPRTKGGLRIPMPKRDAVDLIR